MDASETLVAPASGQEALVNAALDPPPATATVLASTLPIATPLVSTASPAPTSTRPSTTTTPTPGGNIYFAQSGDTLSVVAAHFGVEPSEITSPGKLPAQGLLVPGQALVLPPQAVGYTFSQLLMPDSEVVYSPSTANFDVAAYLAKTHGFLKDHREYLKSTAWTSAADILSRVAIENSINPRILLSLLEYHCGCVTDDLDEDVSVDFLLGDTDFRDKGLYRQLSWAASRLSVGYYGWRDGTLNEFSTAAGRQVHPGGNLNAGSVALLYFFAFYPDKAIFPEALDPLHGLPATHTRLFGDPWVRAESVEPLFPPGLVQPDFILPFEPGRMWSLSSGPHTVWEDQGAQAALDFAPATYDYGCVPTDAWAVALADGLVTRVEYGAVLLDLDGPGGAPADGLESTGWVILYMHIETPGRVTAGTRLKAGQRIGHPSCEGGRATGTHLHLARKYNGEWVLAASGGLPFDLEGWVAQAGKKEYEGSLVRGDQIVIAHPYGSFDTVIGRPTITPTLTLTSTPDGN